MDRRHVADHSVCMSGQIHLDVSQTSHHFFTRLRQNPPFACQDQLNGNPVDAPSIGPGRFLSPDIMSPWRGTPAVCTSRREGGECVGKEDPVDITDLIFGSHGLSFELHTPSPPPPPPPPPPPLPPGPAFPLFLRA